MSNLQKTTKKLAVGTIKTYVYSRNEREYKNYNCPERYKKKYFCNVCSKYLTIFNKKKHKNTKIHNKLKNSNLKIT